MAICQCHDGEVASGHHEFLKALPCVRVGSESLIILICQALRITDFAIGIIFNPRFLTKIASVLVEVVRLLIGVVILSGVLLP